MVVDLCDIYDLVRRDSIMSSKEEFGALLQGADNGDWMKSWANQQRQHSPPKGSRPPSNNNHVRKPSGSTTSEQSPLLPPMPQSVMLAPQLPPMSGYEQTRGHGRSRSEFQFGVPQIPASDPSHPFNRAPLPPSTIGTRRPPRAHSVVSPSPLQQSIVSPLGLAPPVLHGGVRKPAHRRAKSDIPLAMFGSGGSSVGGRMITKADLLKNLPSPRWGGAPKAIHTRSRSRTGSDGHLLPPSDASVSSGGGGYGAAGYGSIDPPLQSIGSVELAHDSKRQVGRHQRLMSDASIKSVTTDMGKSALFKGVTDTGRIRLQLPKDSFRILMDSQLEAGSVYKRKLVDSEDEFFVEFHTEEEEDPVIDAQHTCHCTCDGCKRCYEKQKRLPPDLYVMAVDSTIYRRMLDEVIASRSMP